MKETFDAAWLALREETDHRSRAVGVLPPLREWWRATGRSKVLDLGCGTGSNLRYVEPKLPHPQSWTLVDHDAELLAHIEAPSREVEVNLIRGDLAGPGLMEVRQAHLVTASALLDLVSESWMSDMVDACVAAGCGALFALTYDGAIEWSESDDPMDALVREAVNVHQRRDKGLGPALGPSAARIAEQLFRKRGYRTWLLPSAWRLGAKEAGLVHALVSGWADAAEEEMPAEAEGVREWADRRRTAIAAGDVDLMVGHQDLLALPTTPVAKQS